MLAQIGEFAFVLLSRASNLHLIGVSSLSLSIYIYVCICMYECMHPYSFLISYATHRQNMMIVCLHIARF